MVTNEEIFEFLKEKGVHAAILTASFQRRFQIGYREASLIVDRLEEEGYISKYFPKPQVRYVLKTS
jgi:DNA segregation ATPase FtsK/SpoIIIE-like protein